MSELSSLRGSPKLKQTESASIHSMDENKMMLQMVQALNREMAEMKLSSHKEVSELRATVLALEKEICARVPPSPPTPPISQSEQDRPFPRLTDRLEAIKNFSTPSLRPCTASRDFDPTTPVLAPTKGSFSPRLKASSLKSASQASFQPAKHVEHEASTPSSSFSVLSRPSRPLLHSAKNISSPAAAGSASNITDPAPPTVNRPGGEERAESTFLQSCENRPGRDAAGSHFNAVRDIRELNALYPPDSRSEGSRRSEDGKGEAGKKEGGWKGLKGKARMVLGKIGGVRKAGREWLSGER